MPNASDEIRARTEAFVSSLTVLIKQAALEAASAALGGGTFTAAPVKVAAKRGRGRPKKVVAPAPAAPVAPEVAKPATETVAAINRLIPDVNATTVETASQIFHAEFMKEIADAGTEMEARMTAAQQQVTQAQASGSAAELAAAQQNLAQVQSAQGEKIRQIAAQLQTRLAVFQQMKNAAAAH